MKIIYKRKFKEQSEYDLREFINDVSIELKSEINSLKQKLKKTIDKIQKENNLNDNDLTDIFEEFSMTVEDENPGDLSDIELILLLEK